MDRFRFGMMQALGLVSGRLAVGLRVGRRCFLFQEREGSQGPGTKGSQKGACFRCRSPASCWLPEGAASSNELEV